MRIYKFNKHNEGKDESYLNEVKKRDILNDLNSIEKIYKIIMQTY